MLEHESKTGRNKGGGSERAMVREREDEDRDRKKERVRKLPNAGPSVQSTRCPPARVKLPQSQTRIRILQREYYRCVTLYI